MERLLLPGGIEIILTQDKDVKKVSDGYHTFGDLYAHRNMLFMTLLNHLPAHRTWKSLKHHDGTMYEGWFIAGIDRLEGEQITYHLPMSLWGLCQVVEETPPPFDGHTSKDVLERLFNAL